MLTNGVNYQIRPTVTVYNLADGNTYLYDDMSADQGSGDELVCWFEETILFGGVVRYLAGKTSYLNWEKVSLQ
jgi:hypothetical protein